MLTIPAWLMSALAFATAGAMIVRARRDRRRSYYVALIPASIWLGMVYLFTDLHVFGLHDDAIRALAIRPALALVLALHILSALAALRRGRQL